VAFQEEWLRVEGAGRRTRELVPAVARNGADAMEQVESSFQSYLWRRVDLLTILVARKLGKLPRFFRASGESRTEQTSWAQADCAIRFPRPQADISEDDWDLSLLVTGLVRARIVKLGSGWVSQAGVLAWVGEGCRALDLTDIAVTDSDLAVLTKAFPQLVVLILTGKLLTTSGVLSLAPVKSLKYLTISGVPHISPTILRSLELRGVVVECQTLTKEFTEKFSKIATTFGDSLNKEISRLANSTPPATLEAVRSAAQKAALKLKKQVNEELEAEKLDDEVKRGAHELFVKQLAGACNTAVLQLIAEDKTPDGLISATMHDTLWLAHLAALYKVYEPEPEKQKVPEAASPSREPSSSAA
jgi:hypothetical protein